jgi:hypothetical protein
MSGDSVREASVYMAKLAEQAERYDGICFVHIYHLVPIPIFLNQICLFRYFRDG